MSELFDAQAIIYQNMIKFATNFKKDTSSQKTLEYFTLCSEELDGFWTEYQHNHDMICSQEIGAHEYFSNSKYFAMKEYYQSIKTIINKQYAHLLEQLMCKPGTSSESYDKKGQVTSGSNSLLTINSRWAAVDSFHWEVKAEEDEDNTEFSDAFNKYEIIYNNMRKTINDSIWSSVHKRKFTPLLKITKFDGNYKNWISFKDLFYKGVHNNSSLTNEQKMQFLKAKVKGEAERLIEHLPLSSDNYEVCWEILNNRFNNIKMIFTCHLNNILGLPSMQYQSGIQIKRMHDTIIKSLHEIKKLSVDVTSWDPLLIHLLAQKLDSETYADYMKSLSNPRELPVLQDFLEFLENKSVALETARRHRQESNLEHSTDPNLHAVLNTRKLSTTKPYGFTMSSFVCPLCDRDHGIYNCKGFLEMSNEQKLKTIKGLQLCFNCLFSHFGKKCISIKMCRKCHEPHNTLIHEAITLASSSSASGSAKKTSSTE